jgi:predicted ABC-type ATPase
VAILTVIAGPNGSGKSSIIRGMDFEGKADLLEADAIAKRIDPLNPRHAAVAAGREVIRRTRKYLKTSQSFAIETTLSSASMIDTMREAQKNRFAVHLVYVCLDNPERNIQRVRERVAQGGHDVPDPDIRRRYGRSLANLLDALIVADQAAVYDNSEAKPRKVLETRSGVVLWCASVQPVWVRQVRDELDSA